MRPEIRLNLKILKEKVISLVEPGGNATGLLFCNPISSISSGNSHEIQSSAIEHGRPSEIDAKRSNEYALQNIRLRISLSSGVSVSLRFWVLCSESSMHTRIACATIL